MPTKIYKCTACGELSTQPFDKVYNSCSCPKPSSQASLPLAKNCSKYYALSYLALEKPSEFAKEFQEFSTTLATEFFDYTVRATGGEVRNFSNNDETDAVFKTFPPEISKFIAEHQSCTRKHMYTDWVALKSKFTEIELLGFAQKMFNAGKWRHGFGGESWGKICALAIQFAKKEITPVIFVDTCWGLHHNGNVFLDKEYKIPSCLVEILDAGRAEKMSVIYKYLSDNKLKPELAKVLGMPSSQTEPKIEIYEAPWADGSTIWFPYKKLKNPKSAKISWIYRSYVSVNIPYTHNGNKYYRAHGVLLKDIISEKPVKGKEPTPYKFLSSEPVGSISSEPALEPVPCLPDQPVPAFVFTPDQALKYKINLDTLEETLCNN